MKLQLELNDKNEILQYATIGELANAVECDIKNMPDDFHTNFEPCFYLFESGDIIENPDYVAPEPVIGPSQQDKINAQIMLTQAKQKEDQDKFNAQILLKLAGGTK
ncbi:DUF2977 domain-containing protein [Pediococcus pentosaceus]|jgi:hypothetical protein|uniref:DUF2977 domain-containing protein n=1 Tax=Pediococcus pentosaceus TaxID=1255 RepID=UPI0018A13EC2|nr:DUF2977 domain-containing protein [Pediococcus pentosaceus]MBF7119482.1 DUF2977 domain-containing protein [Pediococcus pentosaceus]